MLKILSPISALLKVKSTDIDSIVFKLHYKWTCMLFLSFCTLVTSYQLWGDPIKCLLHAEKEANQKAIETFCWITSTFTLPISKYQPYPGIGPLYSPEVEVKFHKYYQWIPFVLFLQALLFYMPYFLWETYEGQKMTKLVDAVQAQPNLLKLSPEVRENVQLLADFIIASWTSQPLYFRFYCLCVLLSFGHVLFQLWFVNYFLNGIFLEYGFNGIYKAITADGYDEELEGYHAIFPRMTKCNFVKYGPSGTLEKKDALCVLALNNVAEKVFLICFIWLLILAFVTMLYLTYLLIASAVPEFRYNCNARGNRSLYRLMRKADAEDWFLLHLLSKNLDEITLKELVYNLEMNLVCARNVTPPLQSE